MIYNNRMKKVLDEKASDTSEVVSLSMKSLFELVSPQFHPVFDCTIYSNEEPLDVSPDGFERMLSVNGDRTGYEASANEIRLNDYFHSETPSLYSLIDLGFMIISLWTTLLKALFPLFKYTFMLSCDTEYVTITFYQNREDEADYLLEDLEQYDEAIAIIE